VDHAGPQWQRRGVDPLDAEVREPERRRDHVDDRVERADLVKDDLPDRHAVRAAFGLGKTGEDGERPLSHLRRQRRGSEQRADVSIGPMAVYAVAMAAGRIGMLPVHAYVKFRGGDPAPLDALGVHRYPREAERLDRGTDGVERQPEIQQRPHRHVAAHTGKRVKVRNAHGVLRCAPP
jgi:hypothetical protein